MTFFGMEPSYGMYWYSLFLCFIPLVQRLISDFQMIRYHKTEVDHKSQTIVTGLMMVVFTIALSFKEPASWWQILFFMWAIFFLLFDYSLNVMLGKNFFYIDTGKIHSLSDGLYARIGVPGTAFFKVVIMLLAISLYFFFPYVTGDKTPW